MTQELERILSAERAREYGRAEGQKKTIRDLLKIGEESGVFTPENVAEFERRLTEISYDKLDQVHREIARRLIQKQSK